MFDFLTARKLEKKKEDLETAVYLEKEKESLARVRNINSSFLHLLLASMPVEALNSSFRQMRNVICPLITLTFDPYFVSEFTNFSSPDSGCVEYVPVICDSYHCTNEGVIIHFHDPYFTGQTQPMHLNVKPTKKWIGRMLILKINFNYKAIKTGIVECERVQLLKLREYDYYNNSGKLVPLKKNPSIIDPLKEKNYNNLSSDECLKILLNYFDSLPDTENNFVFKSGKYQHVYTVSTPNEKYTLWPADGHIMVLDSYTPMTPGVYWKGVGAFKDGNTSAEDFFFGYFNLDMDSKYSDLFEYLRHPICR